MPSVFYIKILLFFHLISFQMFKQTELKPAEVMVLIIVSAWFWQKGWQDKNKLVNSNKTQKHIKGKNLFVRNWNRWSANLSYSLSKWCKRDRSVVATTHRLSLPLLIKQNHSQSKLLFACIQNALYFCIY